MRRKYTAGVTAHTDRDRLERAIPVSSLAATRPLRVLLADDEELARRALAAMISRTQVPAEIVGEASDGDEAVRRVGELQPDLVMMDIRMPGQNGIEAARQIRDLIPAAHVVFLTAYDEFEYARDAVSVGADAYLLKPVNRDDLQRMLEACTSRLAAEHDAPESLVRQARELQHLRSWAARQLVFAIVQGDSTRYAEAAAFLNIDSPAGTLVVMRFDTGCGTCLSAIEQGIRGGCTGAVVSTLRNPGGTATIHVAGAEPGDVIDRVSRSCRAAANGSCRFRAARLSTVGLESRRLVHSMVSDLESPELRRIVPAEELADPVVTHGSIGIPRQRARIERLFSEPDGDERRRIIRELTGEVSRITEDPDLVRELCLELIVLVRTHMMLISDSSAALGRGYLRLLQESPTSAAVVQVTEDILLAYERVWHGLRPGQQSWRLVRAVDYILSNLSGDLFLDTVAGIVGISPQHLSRLFKEELESTFTRFVNEQRIDRARYLLMTTPSGVAEIADAVGFRDADYFSKVFRRFCSCAPSEYRRMVGIGER